MEGLVSSLTQGIMHREGIDTKMLRAHVLSIVICTFVALTVFLVYYLIKDYLECITLAVLSSMALRPLKAWTLCQVRELSVTQQYLPTLPQSYCLSALRWVAARGRTEHNTQMTARKWERLDGFWLMVLVFAVYLAVMKMKAKTALLVVIGLLVADMLVRFCIDLFSMCIKLSGWNSQSNAHKAEKCSSFLSLLILFLALLCSFSLAIALIIPTGLELRDQGSAVVGQVQGLGFNLTAEGVTEMVMKYVEEKGGLKAWTGFASFQKEGVNNTVIEYVDKLQGVPWVGQRLTETLLSWESRLIAFGVPVHNVVDFLIENINEVSFYALQIGWFLWSVLLSSATSIFSSFFDFIYCACLYLTLVFFLMTRESSILSSMLSIVPISEEMHTRIEKELSTNVVQVFATIIKVAITYSLCTYMLFDCLDLPFKHTASTFTGLVGFVQILDPWVVTLPWMCSLVLTGMYYRAAAVLGVEYFVLGYCYTDIYSRTVTGLNVTILTLASVFGLSNFGALGVLYGPLIAGLINVFMSQMRGLQAQA